MAYTYFRKVAGSTVRLDSPTRSRVNQELDRKGLGGNKPFHSISKGLMAIGEVLEKNGLEWQSILTGDLFIGESGTRLLYINKTNPADPHSPSEISNSVVRLGWYKHDATGNYEITAYLS